MQDTPEQIIGAAVKNEDPAHAYVTGTVQLQRPCKHIATPGEVYTEVNSSKSNKYKPAEFSLKPQPCYKCMAMSQSTPRGVIKHHAPLCPNATKDDVLEALRQSEKAKAHYQKRAGYWLDEIRKIHGKLAMVKHELRLLRQRLKNKVN